MYGILILNPKTVIKLDVFVKVASGWKGNQLKYLSAIIIDSVFEIGHCGTDVEF